jgi:hypothetical protein
VNGAVVPVGRGGPCPPGTVAAAVVPVVAAAVVPVVAGAVVPVVAGVGRAAGHRGRGPRRRAARPWAAPPDGATTGVSFIMPGAAASTSAGRSGR